MRISIVMAIHLVVMASIASAQHHETFEQRPVKRAEAVQRAHLKAQREKNAARKWAQANGVPMRFEGGNRTMELMGIRGGRQVWFTTDNYHAAISTAADHVRNTAPFNVDGSGLTVGVWDGGSVMASHQELAGRVSDMDGVSSSYHATHIGGTIGASGIALGRQGMVPAVMLDSYDWDNDIAEMTSRAAAAPGDPNALYLSNHSYGTICGWELLSSGNSWSGNDGWHWPYWLDWGSGAVDPLFGKYDDGAVGYDQVVYDAPYFLPFVAAGNDRNDGPSNGATVYYSTSPFGFTWESATYDSALHPVTEETYKDGYDTVKAEACAKNIMTVGAVKDAVAGVNRALANADMTIFSGWGPADDGRIKPDIVANGWDVWSCDNDNTSDYINLSGTSMATPNACGSAALLVDYYGQRFPGGAMRASTLKGVIIHTADDLGNPGPDYAYGWGLMNTLAAAEVINDYANGTTARISEGTISANDFESQYYFVEIYKQGIEPVKATLCWTDPPGDAKTGDDDRTPALVNDLELTILGPAADFYPYRLDYNHPTANAIQNGANHIDNVEQVFIPEPEPGWYKVQVTYSGVLTGGAQDFSLIVSGLDTDADTDGMPDFWEIQHFLTATGAGATVDADGDGSDNYTEFVSGHDPNNAASFFQINNWQSGPASGQPFVVDWETAFGRSYNVLWSTNLLVAPFTDISGSLGYPANSYTDSVPHLGPQQFYRVEVQLAP